MRIAAAVSIHDVRRADLVDHLVHDEMRDRVDAYRAIPGVRAGEQIENFAIPFHLGVVARRDDAEQRGRRVDSRLADHAPDGRIFRAHSPDAHPRGAERLRGERLVIGGDCVEIPGDMIRRVAIGPRRVWIERRRIEVEHLLVRLAHRGHDLLKGQLLTVRGAVAVVPVVAVRADDRDRLLRGHESQHVLHALDEPLLAGNRPRITPLAEVLVVQHQEQVVVRGGEPRELMVAVVHRRGLRHELPHGGESFSQIGDERRDRLG